MPALKMRDATQSSPKPASTVIPSDTATSQNGGSPAANLIMMATAGHQGFLDALRGSTTERVLRHAPCPVLAVPAD